MSAWGCKADRECLSVSMDLWNRSYRQHHDDQGAYGALLEFALREIDAGGRDAGESAWLRAELQHRDRFDVAGQVAARFVAYAKWAHSGYPVLQASRTLAAALMCTETSTIEEADLRMPWGAVIILVPEGLLQMSEGDCVDRILLESSNDDDGIRVVLYSTNDRLPAIDHLVGAHGKGAALLSLLRGDDRIGSATGSTETSRLVRCAGKYAVGLLVSMQYGDNFAWRQIPARRKTGPWSRTEPSHRIATFGRVVSVDFSEAVASYISGGKRGLPSVQTMVRGHYKRQVFGLARSSRKVIWIEPYWRGPEDAPILARPLQLADPRAS